MFQYDLGPRPPEKGHWSEKQHRISTQPSLQSCADDAHDASTCIISSNTLVTVGCLLLHLPELSSHQVGWCSLQPLVKTNSHFQLVWRFDGILRGETWRGRTKWVICTFPIMHFWVCNSTKLHRGNANATDTNTNKSAGGRAFPAGVG